MHEKKTPSSHKKTPSFSEKPPIFFKKAAFFQSKMNTLEINSLQRQFFSKKLLQDYPLSTLLAALSFYHSVFFEAFYLFFNSSCSDTHTDRQLIKSKMRVIIYKNKQLFVIYTELYMELYTELYTEQQ